MTLSTPTLAHRLGPAGWWLAMLLTVATAGVVFRTVDGTILWRITTTAAEQPLSVVAVVGAQIIAVVVRATAWRRVLPVLPLRHAVAALHVSAGANQLLPLRLGEVLEVTSVVRRAGIPTGAALSSSRALRSTRLSAVGPLTLLLVCTSWALEAVVVHQAATWAGAPITAVGALLVTALITIGSLAAIAPGGLGTYEAATTAGLVAGGTEPGTALAVAVTAHAITATYALVAGAIGAAAPAPSLIDRLRLAPRSPRADTTSDAVHDGSADAPVVLFLPAHDEEATVADVVGRVPTRVAGHRVHCLVIDDGSTDRTAELARAAGAEVVSIGRNRGLGAAVRRGLDEAVARGAVAVAFCDADGEYAPEELSCLLAPILDGTADYVVGSRFSGTIHRMLPHRRLGNHVLTVALRLVTRAPITDGQSGYRALSRAAAANARIAHDFNYAQVLTIDLLARGARYAEVPIGYRFRQQGRSFVRLGSYLAAVVPTVHRQLDADVAPLRTDGRPPMAGRSAR